MAAVHYRGFHTDDVPGALVILGQMSAKDGEQSQLNEAAVRHMLASPMIHPEQDFHTAVTESGDVVGVSLVMVNPRTGMAISDFIVHPDFQGQGIEACLLELGDGRIWQRGQDEVPADRPVYINRSVREAHSDIVALLESAGYAEIRRGYEMRIALNNPVEAVAFPAGTALLPFDPARHAQAVHAAQQEAFRDHWGHAEDTPFEEWVHRLNKPSFDPTLWFVAWDGDEVAGFAQCSPSDSYPDMGYVDVLGVRRPWRRRGLGMALLRHAFHTFQSRGFARAGLGVDAQSKTNAVALYERAGMHVHRCYISMRKILRGSAADITD